MDTILLLIIETVPCVMAISVVQARCEIGSIVDLSWAIAYRRPYLSLITWIICTVTEGEKRGQTCQLERIILACMH